MINRVWLSSVGLACLVAGLAAAPLAAGEQGQPARYDKTTMKEPKLVQKVPPQYPPDAKREGVEGTVILDAVIAKDGSVRETRVKQQADARLVSAARAAVEQWRYEPVRDPKGEPIEVIFSVTVLFKLDKK
jgi:TonB family protein